MAFQINTNPDIEERFSQYPENVKKQMYALRALVVETAKEIEGVNHIEETLKCGEPSFITKIGSTLRMDWKAKTPKQYALYFKCTSRLVETFKIHFKNTFTYEGKRAIVFKLDDNIPKQELKQCIKAALMYHKVKHLPTLGI